MKEEIPTKWEVRKALEKIVDANKILRKIGFVTGAEEGDKIYVMQLKEIAKNLGMTVQYERRDDLYYPFKGHIMIGDIELFETFSPEELGCKLIGTKKVEEEQEEIVEKRTKLVEVEKPIYECPSGKVFTLD